MNKTEICMIYTTKSTGKQLLMLIIMIISSDKLLLALNLWTSNFLVPQGTILSVDNVKLEVCFCIVTRLSVKGLNINY